MSGASQCASQVTMALCCEVFGVHFSQTICLGIVAINVIDEGSLVCLGKILTYKSFLFSHDWLGTA